MSCNRFSDDSLGAVANTEVGSRATTPQMKRTTSKRQRQTTPQRNGSAPRSSSAGRVSALAKACFESQSCNRSLSRNAGRKRQQKWENDNMFGLNMFMRKVHALNKRAGDDSDSDEDVGGGHLRQGISVNWQSLFTTLANGENSEALEAYLMCSNSYRVKRTGESKSIRDCITEWDRAEFAWMKVEKRLRTVILRSLSKKESQQFVLAIEDLLLQLEEPEAAKRASSLQSLESVDHLFLRPPVIVHPSSKTSTRDDDSKGEVVISVPAKQLVVTLKDSAFHRLLLHATCQFHNMHSKSFTDKKRDGARATRITPFQSRKCHHTISLVPFVLLKLSNEKGEAARSRTNKENSSENRNRSHTVENDYSEIRLDDLKLEDVTVNQDKNDMKNTVDCDEGDNDDEEYCLVDIVKSSSSGRNPMEAQEDF